ncbi:MAG: UDP-glucuronic acid decarboxylase family protein [Actinomycetota bacterium]
MHIVVTGGAGFVGSHLCERLLRDGHTVLCVDNLITGKRAHVWSLSEHPSFRFLEHNISLPLFLPEPVDAVLHFASPASPVDYLEFPIQTLKVGALGTWHTLGLAMAKGARYVLASTSEVYGDPLVNPQPESYWGNVNPIGPRGVYDEAKRYAEAMVMAYHRTHGIDSRIVRIFNTYGPRMRPKDGRVIPNFIGKALRGEPMTVHGEGTQTRSFTYIDDLVEGIVALLESSVHEPVNIGNPNEMSVLDLASLVRSLCDSSSEIVYTDRPVDDPTVRRPDISRARALLGWEPVTDVRDGLVKTIEWFRAQLDVPASG